jgi:hypothetical protein
LADWITTVRDLAGVKLDEIPAKNLQFTYALNNPGGINFTIPWNDPKCTRSLMSVGQRELIVNRDGEDVWGGYLWNASVSSNDDHVRFAGEGWFSRILLREIHDKLTFIDEDQLDIVWDLIAYTQARVVGGVSGNLGITRFNPAESSAVLRTRRFQAYERPNIGEEIQALTEVIDGFDFEITPAKEWKTYFPHKGTDIDLVFDLDTSVDNLSFDEDATNLVSQISALGGGEAENRCIATVASSSALAAFGLLEDSISFTDIKHFNTLAGKADAELQIRKIPRWQPQVTLNNSLWGQYSVGDRPRVRGKLGNYIDFDERFRIGVINVQVNDEGREVVQVMFDIPESAI